MPKEPQDCFVAMIMAEKSLVGDVLGNLNIVEMDDIITMDNPS